MSSRRYVALFAPFVLACLAPWDLGAGQAPRPSRSAAEVYKEACAACHGTDGRGVPQSQVGFDLPLPDFTDCNFATREPDSDWLAIAHEGGPARGFSKLMPAFTEALTAEELQKATYHIRTFCPDRNWPRGDLNLPRPLATEKAFIEDEAVITSSIPLEGAGAISNKFVYETRFGARNQVELIVPFGWRDNATDAGAPGEWIGGVGDIAVGAKRAIYHNLGKGTIFSVAGEVVLPTGDRDKGFGKGTTVFEPFASFGQILPSSFFLHAQAGLELPADTERAGREGFWRLALGRTFEQRNWGRAWSPMVELLAARELKGGEKVSWDALPQLQWTLSKRQHIMMDIGLRVPLTDRGPRETQLVIYLLWDWFDGGFTEGW